MPDFDSDYSLETLIIKLKLKYFDYTKQKQVSLEILEKIEGSGEKPLAKFKMGRNITQAVACWIRPLAV